MEQFLETENLKENKYPWMKDIPLILLIVIFFGYFNFMTQKTYDILISLYYLTILLIITKILYPPIFLLITKILKYVINPPSITLQNITDIMNLK